MLVDSSSSQVGRGGGYGAGFSIQPASEIATTALESRRPGKSGLIAFEKPLLGKRWIGDDQPNPSNVSDHWVCSTSKWTDLLSGRFKYEEHIDRLELRTQISFLERLARIPRIASSRCLSLCDNAVATGILVRGRSKIVQLNALCRKRYALEVASRITFYATHVGTKRMPMDGLSREPDKGGPLTRKYHQ